MKNEKLVKIATDKKEVREYSGSADKDKTEQTGNYSLNI